MPTITVKNIPDELYEDLKRAAKLNNRSINSEVIACIEQALRSQRLSTEEILERARKLRELVRGHLLTNDEITEAKRAGRP